MKAPRAPGVATLALVLAGCGTAPLPSDPALDAAVDALVDAHPHDVRLGLWLGSATDATYGCDAQRPLATASAIKSAYLVELFAAYAGALDVPPAGTALVVGDPDHPAVRHFAPAVQAEIAAALGEATVREIGFAMIRSRRGPDGAKVSNAVYNAAANLTTALLGGPRGLTEKIHARTPGTDGLTVRRYMLARRDVTGDNQADAQGLATVLQGVARGELAGVDVPTMTAIRAAMATGETTPHGAHSSKGGSLDSDPQCRILSGFYERDGRARVYVVMVEQDAPDGDAPRAGQQLQDLAERLRDLLLERGR